MSKYLHPLPSEVDDLPDKMSDVIDIALRDLESAERSDAMGIDMTWWMRVERPGVCTVCLAGGVMVGLGIDPSLPYLPSHFNEHNHIRLLALDALRFEPDHWSVHPLLDEYVPTKKVGYVDYREDPAEFKDRFREIAQDMRSQGL